MPPTDAIIARLQNESDEKTAFIDSILEEAETKSRDVNAQEMALVRSAQERISEIGEQLGPLTEAAKIANASRVRHASMVREAASTGVRPEMDPATIYRTAGAYVVD